MHLPAAIDLRFSQRPRNWHLCLSVVLVTIGLRARAEENLWLDMARASITNYELLDHASMLADDMLEGREAGSRGGRAAAKYIVQHLEESQLTPAGTHGRYMQPFAGNSQNLLAMLPGTDPELQREYLIVGAHYDHIGYGSRRNSYGPWGYIHNGADDNASGVAALLEVINALSRTDYQPRRSIIFAFWDGEEKGFLGSKHWVSAPTLPFENLKLALNIDMVGRLREGRIEVGGTRSGQGFRRLMSSSRMLDGTWLDFTWEYKENSDHWTFYEAKIPSLYVHTGVHDDYHRPSDDVEKLNIDGMRKVSQYLVEQVCELADTDHLPDFRVESRLDTPQAQLREERPLPMLDSRLGFQWERTPGSDESMVGSLRVKRIDARSTAARAGLRSGDRIVAINGSPYSENSHLPILTLPSEAEVALEIERAGTDMPFSVTVPLRGKPVQLGLSWREDPAEPQMVYVTRVVPYSLAARAGMELNDRIRGLGGQPISGQDDLFTRVQALLASGAQEILFEVESRGAVREMRVPLGLAATQPADATL